MVAAGEPIAIVRVLFVSHACCFDTANGASAANRALAHALARHGCAVEVLSGSYRPHPVAAEPGRQPGVVAVEEAIEAVSSIDAGGTFTHAPPHRRWLDGGVPTTWH